MSCENVQELISLLLDGQVPAEEQGSVLAHLAVCRACGARLAALQTQRAALRNMAQKPVPEMLAARLKVIASHEREKQLARVSIRERIRRVSSTLNLIFDNMMRPMALPATGGLLTAVLLFGLMIPSFTFAHPSASDTLSASFLPLESTYYGPTGRVVTNPYDEVADAEADFPRIASTPSDFLNVVELTIDEHGNIANWNLVRGEWTLDMKEVIVFSRFEPATYMGIPTSGKIFLVQSAPSMTVRG